MKSKLVADGNGGFKEVEKSDTEPAKEEPAKVSEVDTEKAVAQLSAIAERIIEVGKSVKEGNPVPESFGKEITSMLSKVSEVDAQNSEFAKSLETLKGLLKGLTSEESKTEKKTEQKTEKSESEADPKMASLEKQLSELKGTVEKQSETISKQSETIKKLESQPAGSNALQIEKTEKEEDDAWPMDMADDYERRHRSEKQQSPSRLAF